MAFCSPLAVSCSWLEVSRSTFARWKSSLAASGALNCRRRSWKQRGRCECIQVVFSCSEFKVIVRAKKENWRFPGVTVKTTTTTGCKVHRSLRIPHHHHHHNYQQRKLIISQREWLRRFGKSRTIATWRCCGNWDRLEPIESASIAASGVPHTSTWPSGRLCAPNAQESCK